MRQLFEERRSKGHDISTNARVSTTTTALAGSYGNGKIRSGIDKSYPLEPLMVGSSPTPSSQKESRSNSSKSDPATTSSVPSSNFLTRKTNTGPASRNSKKVSPSLNVKSNMVHSSSFNNIKPPKNAMEDRGMANSSSSGHIVNSNDEDAEVLIVPTTTKYSDYVAQQDRDSVLANRLKKMNISNESIPLSAGSSNGSRSSYGRVSSNVSLKIVLFFIVF